MMVCFRTSFGTPEIRNEYQGKEDPKELMPVECAKLLGDPPSQEEVKGDGPTSVRVIRARKQFLTWLRLVIARSWLPDEEPQMVVIRDEFDGMDVIRCHWETKVGVVRVAQTATLFSLKITPPAEPGMGRTVEELIESSERICRDVFKSTGERWTGQGEIVKIPDLSEKIAAHLFGSGIVFTQSNQRPTFLLGRGKFAHELGVNLNVTAEEATRMARPDNEDWYECAQAWRYWFRMILWWNDGKSLGFYFPKDQAGPGDMGGSRERDRAWF